jgi:hypothetical protein
MTGEDWQWNLVGRFLRNEHPAFSWSASAIKRYVPGGVYLLGLPAVVKESELHQHGTLKAKNQHLVFGRIPNALNSSILLKSKATLFNSNGIASDTTEREHAYSNQSSYESGAWQRNLRLALARSVRTGRP